jgi:hypothetical protein
MAPTIISQTHTLIQNQEVSFGTITSPTGFDFIDVFVDGSGNINASQVISEWRLYEIVGGLSTLVAAAPGGGAIPCILDWGTGGAFPPGGGPTPFSPAKGAGFTFELRAFFEQPIVETGPLPSFLASLIGYEEFDTVPNADSGPVTVTIPSNFSEVTIATLPGYAQSLDVVVTQSFDVPIRFTVYAEAGLNGVIAEVATMTLDQVDGTSRIFSPLRLPGATSYTLRAQFDSRVLQFSPTFPVQVSAGMATHSTVITSGGVVILDGDVIGPSSSNTDIKWFGVSLDPVTMPHPVFGDIPVFTAPGLWVATPSSSIVITLLGNANGPSNANHVEDFGIESVNNVPPVTAGSFTPIGKGLWYVGISGATADIPIQLLDTMPPGSKVIVKDEDGSLASFDFDVTDSAGNKIDGLATFVMDLASPGPFGAVTFEKNFNAAPNVWSVVTQ